MFPSWGLGRPFGIKLLIHWTFWLLPLWVILTARPATDVLPLALHLGIIFALFGCVVLHELGHALTARTFGISTDRILLTPIGGIAQFEQPIRTPWQEFCIALAGPLVNVVIAEVLGVLYLGGSALQPRWVDSNLGVFVFMLLLLNLVIVVFNLLPAFPMDGGRVLRSLLAGPLGKLRATRMAVMIGTVLAVLLGLAGIFFLHSPWLVLIAVFVFWSGHHELAHLEDEEHHRADVEQYIPTVLPVRSTVAWPSPAARVTVYVWDARTGRWICEDKT